MKPLGNSIAFVDEGSTEPRIMQATEALANALARAAEVNVKRDPFEISFSSLFIGLLATRDATGEWLRAQFVSSKADLDALLRPCELTPRDLDRLIEADLRATGALERKAPYTRTSSARAALEEAERRADAEIRVTDTVDVLATMISLPAFHDQEFEALRINRKAWATDLWEWFGAAKSPTATPSSPAAASPTMPDFDLQAGGVEPHVVDALRYANELAGSAPIGASEVVTAVWYSAATALVPSPAFKHFVQILPPPTAEKLYPPSGVVPDADRLDPELRSQLARAQRPKAGDTARGEVWGRDLVTAALLCADEQVRPLVASRGRDLDLVRDLWYAFVTSGGEHRPVAEWSAWWHDAGVPLPGPRRAGYAVETDQGDDKLGVAAEARAFARLILDKGVHPPLSIGLLGDWGSGKSFFIEQIKQGIAELKEVGQPELYTQVVEIEFNAWHASDANLWASLVTTIFDKIWDNVSPADGSLDLKAARERLRSKIKEAHGAVHEAETQVQVGQKALELAERDLKRKREILAWNLYVRSITSRALRDLAKNAGWHRPIETISDIEDAARQLAASGNQLRTLASALLEKPLLHIALPTMALLAVTGAIWTLVDVSALKPWAAELSKILVTVAGLVGALAAPLRVARQRVEGLTKGLEKVKAEYEDKMNAVRATDAEGVGAAERARRELQSAEVSVNTARARLAELLNQQASLDPQRRLETFLQDRVESTQYRSQQGIISLVHKDFSELSKYMKGLRESAAQEGVQSTEANSIRAFDRIVLYVDDLDRCRPAHVVNMLEAVHLLLALDLFVVIVAVDARWLTRALGVYYHDLLTGGDERDGMRASTPQSYLEKIFQITYALAPMDPNCFGDYVAFLAGEETGSKAPPLMDRDAPSTREPDGAQEQPGGREKPTPAETSPQPGDRLAAVPAQPLPAAKVRLAASPSVHIGALERKFIAQLAPLIPTPRIAKRLVNVYRVIKAGKSAEQIEVFEREGRATTCLLMLAILFGRPTIAGELLRTLHESTPPFENPAEALLAAMRRRVPSQDEPLEIQEAWIELVETLEAIGVSNNVGQCAREPQEVARYSLASGHDWHTWGRRSPSGSAEGTTTARG
jgi:KAP-like P-loop domain-containing protein